MNEKNTSKMIVNSILAKWPILILYAGLMAFLFFLCILYNIKIMLIVDLIRFTLIPFFLFLAYRVYHEEKLLRSLNKAHSQGQMLTIKPHGLTEKAFIESFNRLQQQRIQYERENEEKFKKNRDYLVMWSHEVKTPLTALKLLAENENEVASIDVQQQIALAYHQLDMILTYERLADFNQDLVFKWYSMKEIVEMVIKKCAAFFIKKQITPHIKIPPVQVLTDAKWVSFILTQLLMNALKYSHEDTFIEIKWLSNRLEVNDKGIGINASDLPRVFEPGFTGENGRRQNSATGMGLYVAYQISEALNLKLDIKSQLGVGTSTLLIFPQKNIKH